MSLRARLLLLIALATLVPTILLGLRFVQDRAKEIDLALTTLALRASSIAADLDEKIQGTAQLQFGLERARDLDNPDRAACSAFLSAVREEYPQYTGILTINPDGRLFCDSLQTSRELDLNDRLYFKNALVTKEAVTLEPVVGRLTGTPVLQIAYPARSTSGQIRFVLLASFNLERFAALHIPRLLDTMDVLFVDQNGTLLVPPRGLNWSRPAGTSIAKTDLFRFAKAHKAGRAEEVMGIDGRKQYWAAADTPGTRDAGLFVMVGTSEGVLVAAANKRLYQDMTVLMAVSLLLFAGVWTLAEIGVRRQVGRIAAMAKKLGAGDLAIRIEPPFPTGELGGLITELNAAAESLQVQHTAIADLNQQLHQSQEMEARTKTFLDTIIEHIPLPITVKAVSNTGQVARAWQFTLVNKAFENLMGVARANLIGKSVRDLYPREQADVIVASDREAITSGGAMVVREFPHATFGDSPILVTARKVAISDKQGDPAYLLTVLEDVTEKRKSELRMAHMAHHDTLTGLPNRAAFNERFATTVERAAVRGERFVILSIDLNGFKEINDVYGHAAGDELLQEVGRRLQVAAEGIFIARVGGDEFALIVTEGVQPAAAAMVAKDLLAAFSEGFSVEGKRVQIGLSIGGAVYPTNGTDAKTLMMNADVALYRAKAEPHTSALFFEPEMGIQLQKRHDLQRDLRLAITHHELLLHYQPEFRMTGDAIGFEALARWPCSKRGMVPPGDFIPIAEEYGLIIPLGEWALREACREAASWARDLTIAVNVSPIQFHHGDLPRVVHSILLETGLPPARLELEITEGVLINDFPRAVSILCQLKALGVRIALDDFGTGYSSLSYLHAFAFDKIKIDQSFISDLEHNRHSVAIVRAVIGIGHSLDVPVLAEGVETEHQRAFLASEGCTQIQGYLTGRPSAITNYRELTSGQDPVPAPDIVNGRKVPKTTGASKR